jgi:hypothetical protein
MSRRKKPKSFPLPPETAKAFEQLFPEGLKFERPGQISEITKYLARQDLGPRSPPKPSGPKPGSAAAWIDAMWPDDEWRLMTGKHVHDDIVQEANRRGKRRRPSYSAVLLELRKRRQQPKTQK